MALVKKIQFNPHLEKYANLLLGIVLKTFDIAKYERVDVMLDRCDNKLSIKDPTENPRSSKNIHGPNKQLLKQWAKFMAKFMDVSTS